MIIVHIVVKDIYLGKFYLKKGGDKYLFENG